VKRLLLVVVAIAGCKAKTDNLPIGGGGVGGGAGGGGGGWMIDSPAVSDAGVMGRVCLVSDPRNLVGCAATGADGLTVTLGTSTAMTAADGSFSFPTQPEGSGLVWHVTGTNLVTSVMPLATVAQIPALTITTYGNLLADNGEVLAQGQGSVLARVVHAGAPLTDAVATTSPLAQYQTVYDGATAQTWGTTATGAYGTAFIAAIAAGATTVKVKPSGASPISITASVEDGALTFLTFDAP